MTPSAGVESRDRPQLPQQDQHAIPLSQAQPREQAHSLGHPEPQQLLPPEQQQEEVEQEQQDDPELRAKRLRRREHVLAELLESERRYVESLGLLVEHFLVVFRQREGSDVGPLRPGEAAVLFSNLETIFRFNARFLKEMVGFAGLWGRAGRPRCTLPGLGLFLRKDLCGLLSAAGHLAVAHDQGTGSSDRAAVVHRAGSAVVLGLAAHLDAEHPFGTARGRGPAQARVLHRWVICGGSIVDTAAVGTNRVFHSIFVGQAVSGPILFCRMPSVFCLLLLVRFLSACAHASVPCVAFHI